MYFPHFPLTLISFGSIPELYSMILKGSEVLAILRQLNMSFASATQMLYKLCSWRSMAFKITEYNSGIVQKMINVSGKLYLNLQSGESCSHFSACKTHVADVAKNWVILRQQHTPWWYITQQDYVGPCSQALLDQLTCVNPSSAYFIWSYTLNWCILDTHDDDSMIENKFLHDWFAHWFLYTEDSTNACLKY